jgi:hypothetical protein
MFIEKNLIRVFFREIETAAVSISRKLSLTNISFYKHCAPNDALQGGKAAKARSPIR